MGKIKRNAHKNKASRQQRKRREQKKHHQTNEHTDAKHMINYNECFCNFIRCCCHRSLSLQRNDGRE